MVGRIEVTEQVLRSFDESTTDADCVAEAEGTEMANAATAVPIAASPSRHFTEVMLLPQETINKRSVKT
jgi:hypothetical protein